MRACAVCGRKCHGARCATHARTAYRADHRRDRRAWAKVILAGAIVICPRCRRRITPDQPWHLGHQDDRTAPTRPEHDLCNLRAAAAITNGGR